MNFLLKLTISVALLAAILWQLGDLHQVGGLIGRMDPLYALLVLAASTLDRALMTFKWARLLRGGGAHLPLLRGMKIYCASSLGGMLLPTSVGGDAIRAISTVRAGLDSTEVVASIIVERMVGFLATLLVGLGGLLLLSHVVNLDDRFTPIWWGTCLLIAGATTAFAISFSPSLFDLIYSRVLAPFAQSRILGQLRKLHGVYLSYRTDRRSLLIFFGLTIFEQLFSIVDAWLIALGLGVDVSFTLMAGIIPPSILLARLPVSINGIGILDAIFVLLMPLAHISATEAVSIALTGRLLQMLSWSPWGIAHLIDTTRLKVAKAV
jgi:uncharacterized protein (TIRG00374 family)